MIQANELKFGTMITISISKKELLQKLQAASRIISSKPILPILSCFHFHIHDNKLVITAADTSGRIVQEIDNIPSTNEISICYESKILIDSLKTLPEQPVEFQINENLDTTIKYQGGKFQMMGKDASVFPEPKSIPDDAINLEMLSTQFLRGIEKVYFCAANDELRPILGAVYIEIKDNTLNFVSTDGSRMAILSYQFPTEVGSLSFALPQKIAGVVKNILPKKDTPIHFAIGLSNLEIRFENYIITAQLLEGRFPNYRSVIPQNNDIKMSMPVSDLKSSLNRVMVFANQASQLIQFALKGDSLILTGQDIDYSVNAEERLSCESVDTITLGMKGTYLYEILSAIDSDRLVMTFSAPNCATLILPEINEEGESLTFLLMPMMLNN